MLRATIAQKILTDAPSTPPHSSERRERHPWWPRQLTAGVFGLSLAATASASPDPSDSFFDTEQSRCITLLRAASVAGGDVEGSRWFEFLRLAWNFPESKRLECACLDEVLISARTTSVMLDSVQHLLALGYAVKAPERAYRFLTSLDPKDHRPELATLIRKLLPTDYLAPKLYLGADQPRAALFEYLRHALHEPHTPLSAVLRERDQLLRSLNSVTPEQLVPAVAELSSAWRGRVLNVKAASSGEGELPWLREITEVILRRAPLRGYETQAGCLARPLAEAGESALLAQGLARQMDLDDCGPKGTLLKLLDAALCRRDVETSRVLVGELPGPARRFSLGSWLLCLPARELGGAPEPYEAGLRRLLTLGGTFPDELEGASPADALQILGWPELSALVGAAAEGGARATESEGISETTREKWLVRRLSSIAGEDYECGGSESEDSPNDIRLERVQLGASYSPQYVLSGACGNVNCGRTFFGTENGRYRVLLQTAGYSWTRGRKHHGLVELAVAARSGAATHCETLYRFDGKSYQPQLCHETGIEGRHRVSCPSCP